MFKKIIAFLALSVFLVGAAGGCFNFTTPDLSGNWQGSLDSSKNPSARIRITITNLVQDPGGNFTSGVVTVTYTAPVSNTQYTLTANVYGESTDQWRARIKAKGYVTSDQTPALIALILFMTGNQISVSSGDYYDLAFTFPHFYGCRGGDLTSLTGDYQFNMHINTNAGQVTQLFDEGTANITRIQ
ncbi:MAG: hypothetical protein ACP5RW_07050 [bacterium]